MSPLPAIGFLLAAGAAAGIVYNVLSPRGLFRPAPAVVVNPSLAPADEHLAPGRIVSEESDASKGGKKAEVSVEVMSLDAVREIVAQGTAVIVDARSVQSFEYGHIPGAVNVPAAKLPDSFEARRHLLPPGVRILVYCASANCDESEKLLETLMAQGYARLLHYPNGWNEWELAGLPSEKGSREQ